MLNLSGEIGLTKNRLTCLRSDMVAGKSTPDTLKALDEAVSQLDLLVSDLQNAVMKTRMQPIGRLFQKYPRLARDLARSLGKDVELVLEGEETEIDKTMIEDLNDPLVHLVRNAVDHGVDSPEERAAAGKPAKSVVKLSAQQVGDHIVIEITDDGRGMRADVLRKKALDKGLIDAETANSLDERQSLNLVFLPGFSTKDMISDVSGRGVGMDVVKTNITKLNGRIDVKTVVGQGSVFTITLPLTLAILPVLIVRLGTAAVRDSVVDGARNHADQSERHPTSFRARHLGGAGRSTPGAYAGRFAGLAGYRIAGFWRADASSRNRIRTGDRRLYRARRCGDQAPHRRQATRYRRRHAFGRGIGGAGIGYGRITLIRLERNASHFIRASELICITARP